MSRLRVVAAGLLALSGVAHACGVCVEDKVAAAYDHAVVMRAADRGQVVVFAEVLDARVAGAAVREAANAARRGKGIEASSVRTSDAPSTLSFALDTRATSPAAALARIERAMGGKARLTLLKVMP
jgi:hypothetical protein